MSHQTGIQGSQELLDTFQSCYTSSDIRMLKIVIDGETMVPAAVVNTEGDEREDYDRCVLSAIEEKEACYVLYRLDSQNAQGYNYLFISYSPDFAHVRQKMLYAGTRATLKSTFGVAYVADELFGTVPEDVSLEGYDKHKRSSAAPAPLTDAEIEKKEIRAAETGVEIGASTKRSVATGVEFPFNDDVITKIDQLKAGEIDYVQMGVDTAAERITLALAGNYDADAAGQSLPDDAARYSLFRFKHNHEGNNLESIVFAYSCPGYKLSVKDRMLYASCKNPVMEAIESGFKIPLDTKMEITDGTEFTHESLYDHLHPAKVVFKQKFARPPPPGGRRLTTRPKK